MSHFHVGQRVRVLPSDLCQRLEHNGYSLTGLIVSVNFNDTWAVKVLMDISPEEPLMISRDKEVVSYHLSFTKEGYYWSDDVVAIEVIE